VNFSSTTSARKCLKFQYEMHCGRFQWRMKPSRISHRDAGAASSDSRGFELLFHPYLGYSILMNAKVALSALVLALSLSACGGQESAPVEAAQEAAADAGAAAADAAAAAGDAAAAAGEAVGEAASDAAAAAGDAAAAGEAAADAAEAAKEAVTPAQ
jgi:hypothetical protein